MRDPETKQLIQSSKAADSFALVCFKTAMVFVACVIAGASLVILSEDIRLERSRHNAAEEARTHVALIQQQLNHAFSLTYAMALLLRREDGEISNFPAMGAELLRYNTGVSSLQLAPKGVVRQIIPLPGNELAIGHDLLQDEGRTKEAFLAVRTRVLTLAGPFELIQGGQAVVGRLPVFLEGRHDPQPRIPLSPDFWGFISVLIKLDNLLTSARLNELATAGYQFELWRVHPDTSERHVFLRSSSRPLDQPLNVSFEVPNGLWTLSLVPSDGWTNHQELLGKSAIALLVSCLVAALSFLVFKQPLLLQRLVAESVKSLKEHQDHLEERVAERTAELTRLTEQLRQRSDEQEAILETATSGIVLFDRRTMIRCNRRTYEMFAWPHGQLIGQASRCWYPDDESFQQDIEGARQDIKQGKTHKHERLLRRYDGTKFWVRMTGRAIDPNQPAQGSVWIFDDITAERDAIARIIEARQMAEQAAQGKAAFLANMSHEIRTPMNAIIGFSDLLRRSLKDPDHLKKIDRISGAGKHLLGVINDILDLSKIDAGKAQLVLEPVDLHQLVDGVAAMLSEVAAAKQIILRQQYDTVPQFVVADSVRLTQALLNLASNAVKFTSEGTVSIQLATVNEKDNQVVIRFSVVDTGIGIAPEILPVLFSPFQQADSTTTRRFGGTGLGLSITQRLAKMMGGEAGVTSELGLGSTFWFTGVFAKAADALAASIPDPVPSSDLLLTRHHSGARVLLVEDEPINQALAVELLTEVGLAVDVACNGKEAVERVRNAAPLDYDIVLMDMQMPEMDGLEATRQIRMLKPRSMPIIAMTANTYSEDQARCRDAGMDDFVGKPVDPDVLFSTLLKWLEKS